MEVPSIADAAWEVQAGEEDVAAELWVKSVVTLAAENQAAAIDLLFPAVKDEFRRQRRARSRRFESYANLGSSQEGSKAITVADRLAYLGERFVILGEG